MVILMKPVHGMLDTKIRTHICKNECRNFTLKETEVLLLSRWELFSDIVRSKTENYYIILTNSHLFMSKESPHKRDGAFIVETPKRIHLRWCFSSSEILKSDNGNENRYSMTLSRQESSIVIGTKSIDEWKKMWQWIQKLTFQTNAISNYIIQEVLDSSHMSKTYRLVGKSNETQAFCKRYNKSAMNSDIVNFLRNHIKMLSKLLTTGLVPELYSVQESNGSIYIITEFLEGGLAITGENASNITSFYHVALQLVGTLKKLKSLKVILRVITHGMFRFQKDSKSTQHNSIKITNLGYACYLYKPCLPLFYIRDKHYLAPEILSRRRVGFYLSSCDIYTLGLLLFEVYFGIDVKSVPFEESFAQYIEKREAMIISILKPQSNRLGKLISNPIIAINA